MRWIATLVIVGVLSSPARAQTYDELAAMVGGPWHHVPNPVDKFLDSGIIWTAIKVGPTSAPHCGFRLLLNARWDRGRRVKKSVDAVNQMDDREKARLYRLAADQGDPDGQCCLASFYEEGRGGLPKDEREAARPAHTNRRLPR
jgi:hypothetical protein